MEVTRHFTATTLIVHKNRVLLHLHKKLNRWLPVGGHIDRDELPHEAARREVQEEADIEVEFYTSQSELKQFSEVQELPQPARLLLEDINPFHQHIDFVFYAYSEKGVVGPNAEEAETLRWFTLEELSSESSMPDDVIFLAREALELLAA